MYGNVLSNAQIESMRRSHLLTIQPYAASRMKLAHYRLSPSYLGTPGKLETTGLRHHRKVHDFRDGTFQFEPHEYLIVQIQEKIFMPEGLVGNFVPASTLIEQGFGLTAGKLDADYGQVEEQRILFGLTNLLNEPNVYDPKNGIAHIYFVDFRGTERLHITQSPAEKKEYSDRFIARRERVADDGGTYDVERDPKASWD